MIPKVTHSLWTGDPMPDHLATYVATWVDVHPTWEHIMWSDDDFGWLRNQDLYDFAEAITKHSGQFRADVARYEILGRFGGVWVDCDFEALEPIDALLEDVECFAAWETDDVWIGNAILGCVPGHPLMDDLVAGLPANVKAHRGRRPNVLSGPQYLTPKMRDRDDVTLFSSSMFYPYDYDNLDRAADDFPDAVAVHRWENTRSGKRHA